MTIKMPMKNFAAEHAYRLSLHRKIEVNPSKDAIIMAIGSYLLNQTKYAAYAEKTIDMNTIVTRNKIE